MNNTSVKQSNNIAADTIVVLDFETTGLSPEQGDRAIEIGAVRIRNGEVIDSFQELMNPGRRINSFIEQYTGITNPMLSKAKPCADVMSRFADYIGDDNLLAHNASFDKKFLDAEFTRINRSYKGSFACSLLVSRRVYQDAPNHRLGTLVDYKNLSSEGNFHRALFDSQMTAKLWLKILEDLGEQYQLYDIPFAFITKLAKTPKNAVPKLLLEYAKNRG
ncbi:PolC-type DNA polymerase III [Thalassomonas sp. M1454]|uniref:3'-5' exonuclease n=1 Tax=Thalassomonas sp. M1454 TaxID=2594477 RepID=UPI001180B487|nr:3'-5' exonuclease [Thalassomonas sp. M1454]TRX57052.1 3'-5' exonuclease [Thalassomonas sp. M1454]